MELKASNMAMQNELNWHSVFSIQAIVMLHPGLVYAQYLKESSALISMGGVFNRISNKRSSSQKRTTAFVSLFIPFPSAFNLILMRNATETYWRQQTMGSKVQLDDDAIGIQMDE